MDLNNLGMEVKIIRYINAKQNRHEIVGLTKSSAYMKSV